MKLRIATILVLTLMLPFGLALATSGANADQDIAAETTSGVYDYDENAPQMLDRGAVPWTDFAVHGTAWVRELPGQFSMFKPLGWGIEAKAKAAGYQWVHIAIPYATYIEDIPQKVRHVEFCAKSSNGALTKPVRMDIWAGSSGVATTNITWAANNNKQCAWINWNPGVWYEDIGLSVRLYFANSTDKITLYKAWIQTER